MTVFPLLDVFLGFMAVIGVLSVAVAVNDVAGWILNKLGGRK